MGCYKRIFQSRQLIKNTPSFLTVLEAGKPKFKGPVPGKSILVTSSQGRGKKGKRERDHTHPFISKPSPQYLAHSCDDKKDSNTS